MSETLSRHAGRKAHPLRQKRNVVRGSNERFEALLDDMSAEMARVPAHKVDQQIEQWLREIVLALDIDRSTVWERVSDIDFLATYWWGRPDVAKMPEGATGTRVSPWATAKILSGEPVMWSSAEELPKEPEIRRFVQTYGPTANATLPLEIGGSVVGAMSFGKFRGPREWPPSVVRRLRVVGQLIAGALDRKRTDLRVSKLQDEVTLAARRSMMGQLAASIAHELNQPLGAILSNVNAARRMLGADRPNPQETMAALGDIAEDTKRAGEIIRRVRALFKDNYSPREMVELDTLLAEIEGLLRSEAMLRKVSLRVEAAQSLPPVTGDGIQLQQCILNLALNAFESIAAAEHERREVLVQAVQEGPEWVAISVRDTGRGIDPSVQDKLFDPFVTSKPQGMGMGLVITRSIVENHGGKIFGKPNSDAGATFTFTLPVNGAYQHGKGAE